MPENQQNQESPIKKQIGLDESAVELKKIRKQIKKMQREKEKEIKKMRREKVRKFIEINRKASCIIQGEALLNETTTEESPLKDCKGIPEYWKKVLLKSEYERIFKSSDHQIIKFIQSVDVIEINDEKTSISFKIRNGHRFIKEGTYIRTIHKNCDEEPISLEGTYVENAFRLKKGFFLLIFLDSNHEQDLIAINQCFECLCEEIIPFSLEYYLKQSKNSEEEGQRDSSVYEQSGMEKQKEQLSNNEADDVENIIQ